MNYKTQQLILHFGLPKTGSSALQRALFNQRDTLLKNHNTLYPGKYENHFYFRALFSTQPESLFQIQMLRLKDNKAVTDFLESYRQDVLTEINSTRPERIIISSEAFPAMKRDELRMLQAFLKTIADEIVLFAYIRDPWSGSKSLLQEQILTGYRKKEAKFIYRRTRPMVFGRFEEVFGVRAIVAPYLQTADGFNVIVDFCQRFGFDALVSSADENASVRKGMNLESSCVMLQLNHLYPVFDENNNFIPDPARDLMRQTIRKSPLSTTPLRISTQTAKEIYEDSKSDMELLEKTYFGGKKYFTEYYHAMKTTEFEDTLTVSTLDSEQLANFLLACMRILAELVVDNEKMTELDEIKNSKAWKVMMFFRRIRITLAPPNSRRGQMYQRLTNKVFTLIEDFRKSRK